MTELVTFVRARLEERRAAAQAAYDEASDYEVIGSDLAEAHFLYWRPAEVLADVEAKRRIVEEYADHAGATRSHGYDGVMTADILEPIIRLLALPYADHPEFDEGWRP